MPSLTPLTRASADPAPLQSTDEVSRTPSWASSRSTDSSGASSRASLGQWWTRLMGGSRPAPLPTQPCVSIAPGRKVSAAPMTLVKPSHFGDDPGDPETSVVRASLLFGTRLPPLLMSQTLERGSYGKFRLAVDAFGNVFAVKEFRTTQWVRKGFFLGPAKAPKTNAMERGAICREAQLSALAKGALYFYDLVDVDDKVYGVLPYCNGSDVFMLADALNQTHRGLGYGNTGLAAVMTYVGHAVASTLQDFHAKGFAHKDVRLENILWDTAGQVALSDFGKGESLQEQGGLHQMPFSAQVSHLAPECLCDDEPLDAKIDVWSLGVSLLDLWIGGDHGDCNPFTQAKYLAERLSHMRVVQRETIAQWGMFHHAYCKNKAIVVDLQRKDLSMYSYFEELFGNIEQEDSELCTFLITRMLTPSASERADAAEVFSFMKDHLNRARYGLAQYVLKRCGRSATFLERDRAVLAALRGNAKTARV